MNININSESSNEYLLVVMSALKKQPYFFKVGQVTLYRLSAGKTKAEEKRFLGIHNAILDLRDNGALTIHNRQKVWREKEMITEYELIINFESFNLIYDHLRSSSKHSSFKLSREECKSILEETLLKVKLGKKEKRFINILNDFKPHLLSEIMTHCSTDHISSLKTTVNKKLQQYDFVVTTQRGKRKDDPGSYTLEYIGVSQHDHDLPSEYPSSA